MKNVMILLLVALFVNPAMAGVRAQTNKFRNKNISCSNSSISSQFHTCFGSTVNGQIYSAACIEAQENALISIKSNGLYEVTRIFRAEHTIQGTQESFLPPIQNANCLLLN